MARGISLRHDNLLINNHLELTVNLALIAPGTPIYEATEPARATAGYLLKAGQLDVGQVR
jgi:hypothetical protein